MTPRVASLAVAVERLPCKTRMATQESVIADKLFLTYIDREPATRSNFVYLRDPPWERKLLGGAARQPGGRICAKNPHGPLTASVS